MHHDPLQTIADKIKTTHLFTGPSDLDRIYYKQLLFLVAAGKIFVAQALSAHWEPTPNGRITKPDDIEAVKSLLDNLGLVYQIRQDKHAVVAIIAQTNNHLVEHHATTAFTIEQQQLLKQYGLVEMH